MIFDFIDDDEEITLKHKLTYLKIKPETTTTTKKKYESTVKLRTISQKFNNILY